MNTLEIFTSRLNLASSFRRKPESRLLAHKLDPGFRRDDIFLDNVPL